MNDGLDRLRDLLSFEPTKKPRRPRRGNRQWHWDIVNGWAHKGHYSSHWDLEEALENTPTKPGKYFLMRGSRGSFVIEKEITIQPA